MVTQTHLPVSDENTRKPVSMRLIRKMTNQIVEKFNPDAIILFGSYADGNPNANSDVDLLVIMETPQGELETALEISRALQPLPFSVDIVARSRSVIERRKAMEAWFLREITQKGKILHARTSR